MTHEKQQLQEAILAGERALSAVREAEKALGSAANWGLFDMLGGDFFATLVKRSRMKDAQALIDDAQRRLAAFQRELRDVELLTDVGFDDDGLLAFADYVFDGFLADFLVQRRIGKARDRLSDVSRQVSSIVAALKAKARSME